MHAGSAWGGDHEAQPYRKDNRQPKNAESSRIVFPREEHNDWLFNTKWSALETHTYIGVTLYRLNRLYLETHTYIYIYM